MDIYNLFLRIVHGYNRDKLLNFGLLAAHFFAITTKLTNKHTLSELILLFY